MKTNTKTRTVYLNAAGIEVPALAEDQLQSALSMEPTNPVWRALRQVLDDAMVAAVSDVSAQGLTDSERAHAAGRIEVVTDLLERLERLRAGARRTERREGPGRLDRNER